MKMVNVYCKWIMPTTELFICYNWTADKINDWLLVNAKPFVFLVPVCFGNVDDVPDYNGVDSYRCVRPFYLGETTSGLSEYLRWLRVNCGFIGDCDFIHLTDVYHW